MSYSRFRVNSYENERVRFNGYESYKPNEDRGQPHDYNNNFERDRVRDMDQGRRDSRDMRDPREPRGPPRSPHLSKKGSLGSPKRLHIDTKVVDGPRSSSSTRSAMSAFGNVPTEPAANRVGKSNPNTLPNSAITPIIPKAKDPKLQDVLDAVFKCNKTSEERTFLKLRKSKLLREDQRRQAEVSKISGKVDDYAPYLEFKQRFEESGKAERDDVSKRLAELDDQYAEDLEKVVCAISSHTPTNPQAADQAASLTKLEAEFEKFQKQASEGQRQMAQTQEQMGKAQVQIQILLNDRDKSNKTLAALEQDFTALKSRYTTLESDHTALKSENSELRQQVADLKSTKDFVQRVQDEVNKLSEELLSLKTKVDDVDGKVRGSMEKVEDLDMETYNEILETWIDHDFKTKLLSHDTLITALRQDLQSFQESATSRLDKSETSVQGTGAALQALEKARQATPPAANQATGDIMAFVEEKLNSLNEVIQKVVADSGDACAEMVDEVRLRIDNVQTTVNTLSLTVAASKDPDMVTRIGALQQITDQQSQSLRRFENRIESIEGQRLGERIVRVHAGLVELEKKVKGIQENNGYDGVASTEAIVKVIKPEIDNAKKRFDALELSVRVLDSQWSNLSSKQMAERILQQLDPYGQRNEARVARVENELMQLKNMIFEVEQKLLASYKDKKIAEIMKDSPLDGKRHASSESPSEELMTKKRKLGSNGQFAPQQHRSSSYNL
ncbi:uncharacterized protein F4807DRAFT_52894 [Annulohypoxylon truncatum]|uniref:uncharacterized protein n=1 Tax=Annulohypoxylon truncatum TaxID=327061 RepID=UPI002008AC6E|nr:uncharacterized protein F4807DRAFT_52894 [Annulohypoxylon truncatum]KAI1210591.1 hypothetical protein F4807DRAFT_52894 [Annulohypoxylon truncatum]